MLGSLFFALGCDAWLFLLLAISRQTSQWSVNSCAIDQSVTPFPGWRRFCLLQKSQQSVFSHLVSIPYCNNNVVVCNRAGWDKNQTDFKRKGGLQVVYEKKHSADIDENNDFCFEPPIISKRTDSLLINLTRCPRKKARELPPPPHRKLSPFGPAPSPLNFRCPPLEKSIKIVQYNTRLLINSIYINISSKEELMPSL